MQCRINESTRLVILFYGVGFGFLQAFLMVVALQAVRTHQKKRTTKCLKKIHIGKHSKSQPLNLNPSEKNQLPPFGANFFTNEKIPLTAGGGTLPCGSEKCWDGFKLQRGHVHFRWLCSPGFRSCCKNCSMDATLVTLHRRWDRSLKIIGMMEFMPCPFLKGKNRIWTMSSGYIDFSNHIYKYIDTHMFIYIVRGL